MGLWTVAIILEGRCCAGGLGDGSCTPVSRAGSGCEFGSLGSLGMRAWRRIRPMVPIVECNGSVLFRLVAALEG